MQQGIAPRAGGLPARQRFVIVGGLVVVIAVSWAYLLWLARDMSTWAAAGQTMHAPGFAWTVVMWVVMMAAMMFPTALPMIVMHARFQRGHTPGRSATPYTTLFAAGYGVAWTGYAAVAAVVQVELESAAAMHPMAMALTSAPASAAVLIAAGVFQFTSLKNSCLSRCRSPIGYFMTKWRDGLGGALRMGVHNGSYCVVCCAALMALMFVVGTMNMLWVALLTVFMLVEKIGPRPKLVTRGSGLALVAAGVLMLVH